MTHPDAPHLQRLKRSEQVDNANEHNSLSNRNLWVFLENGKHRLEISNINTVLNVTHLTTLAVFSGERRVRFSGWRNLFEMIPCLVGVKK